MRVLWKDDNKDLKVPIKMWTDDIEEGALDQAYNMAQLPFVHKWIAIMPDVHQGYGMPIGGVMATKDVIVPNAAGVDIGCGMCAIKTSLTDIDVSTLKKIMGKIREVVPVGFKHHEKVQIDALMPRTTDLRWNGKTPIVNNEYNNALKQIGTLGSGNHFIEIQKGSDGHIWIMIHSGSRNIGYKVAKHYNELAIKLNELYYSQVPKEYQLAFLPIGSKEAGQYIAEMNYCVEFAFANRLLMMNNIGVIFLKIFGNKCSFLDLGNKEYFCITPTQNMMINIAHNYARIENHFGKNVWVHRKGATSAKQGEIGIIPGSQGTKSYIVKGLGNPDSFTSCSHGAGRKMSRTRARNELNINNEVDKLDKQGIVHSLKNQKDLDEAPGAYKDINTVMDNQKDLVEILVELTPLAVIKG